MFTQPSVKFRMDADYGPPGVTLSCNPPGVTPSCKLPRLLRQEEAETEILPSHQASRQAARLPWPAVVSSRTLGPSEGIRSAGQFPRIVAKRAVSDVLYVLQDV